jgi:hypothetical protein
MNSHITARDKSHSEEGEGADESEWSVEEVKMLKSGGTQKGE